MKSLDYFKEMYSKMQEDYFAACKRGDTQTANEILVNVKYVLDAINALRKKATSHREHVIPWSEIREHKSKPVYIEEKQRDGDEWFGWWDILDEVFPGYIRTAYSEEMLKDTKGVDWEIYDYPTN